MNHTSSSPAAALLAVAFCLLLSACASDDVPAPIDAPSVGSEEPAPNFTATLAAKGSDASGHPSRSVDADGNTQWVVGEQVSICYQKNGEGYAEHKAIGTVTAVDDHSGQATLTASLEGAMDGSTIYFCYPASLSGQDGGSIDNSKLLVPQEGTIADISTRFDGAEGSGTLLTDGTSCATTSPVVLENKLVIGRFIPQLAGTPISGITHLIVSVIDYAFTAVASGGGTFGTDGIYLALRPFANEAVTITAVTADKTYTFTKTVTLEKGKLYRSLAIPMTERSREVDLAALSSGSNFIAVQGDVLSGSLPSDVNLLIAPGAQLTLSGVNIDHSGSWFAPNGISCLGDATIQLSDGTTNTLKGDGAGLLAGPAGSTLTILGSGALTATGGGGASGIGAPYNNSCGDIVISGGIITATGGVFAAGIGSGNDGSSCGDIFITGGTVTATGGNFDAGIGAGYMNSPCGSITISGGSVTAQGGLNAAGIGCGNNHSPCGDINITGDITRVTATRVTDGCYPIGSGRDDSDASSVTFVGVPIFDGSAWFGIPSVGDESHPGNLRWQATGDKDGTYTWTLAPKAY